MSKPYIFLSLLSGGEVIPGHWVPLMYIFCPNKEGETYEKVFTEIKKCLDKKKLKLAASYLMMDFEVAMRNAFRDVFGSSIQIKGCHFHFG